jgi:protein TonB
MDYAANNYEAPFKRFLGYSAWLHIGLFAAIGLSVWIQRSGNPWGGIGGGDSGTKVNLVSSAGIPMPHPVVPTPSDVVDPTKGLAKEEPKIEPPKADSAPILKFKEKQPPPPPSKKSKVFEPKIKPPDNATPYGKGGGQLDVPTGYSPTPGASASGLAVQGQGGGDFASRYGWYIESVRRAIGQNWIQTSIDPSIRAARQAHAVAAFRIYRDGSIKNIRLDSSSGNRSMDDSATRALLSIDRLPALPADYSGAYVDVTFDFDLSSTR